jgi:hypothetical protein
LYWNCVKDIEMGYLSHFFESGRGSISVSSDLNGNARHRMKKLLLHFLFITAFCTESKAQYDVYVAYVPLGGSDIQVMLLDVETCAFCNVASIPLISPNGGLQYSDMLVLPDGRILILRAGGSNDPVEIFTPPSQVPDVVIFPTEFISGVVIAPNGQIYAHSPSGLYVLNLSTNTFDLVGPYPPAIALIVDAEFFVYNGAVYGVDMNNPPQIFQVNLTNPSQSFFTNLIPVPTSFSTVGHYGNTALLSGGPEFFTYNPATNTLNSSCNLSSVMVNTTTAISAIPANVPLLGCSCATNAGATSTPAQNLCIGQMLNFNNTGGFLESDDTKQYVLFTDPADTLGSIVAINSTPSFSFSPPLVAGETYYFAAMAGNSLNGIVDISDPCLDFSNAQTVIWNPLPAVAFAVANPNTCPGNCVTVTANFTGTPPFSLTYDPPGPGANVTQSFPGNTGSIQVCLPPNTPIGNVNLQAISLTDNRCTCN